MKAREIIVDAYQRCNRLSPGETLSGDDLGRGLDRLNMLIDELSSQPGFLYQDVITSAVQNGNITLGVGAWAAIPPGTVITSMSIKGLNVSPITIEQYNSIYTPTTQGHPTFYAQDGLSNVYLYPVASGQTIKIQTTIGAKEFVDVETDYTLPPGYKSALSAMLALIIAPVVMSNIPPSIIADAAKAQARIKSVQPPIHHVYGYGKYIGNTSAALLNGT